MMEIGSQRAAFEVSDEVVYLNAAGMSPLLRSVRAAGERGLARRAAPWTIRDADWFDDVERLRTRFAGLVNADPDGVALVPSTSYGLAVAARNLRAAPGAHVLVLHDEFPSSYHTWQAFAGRTGARLVVVTRERGQPWTAAVLAAVDERAAVVVVPQVHWTDGAPVDVARVAAAARSAGAALVVDGSQSVGAIPVDVAHLRPDFLVTVGYKWLLGPMGLGYLVVDEAHRDGQPLEENWSSRAGSDDFAAVVGYADAYLPGARRFDVGQHSNFNLVPMAIAGIEALAAWQVPAVEAALAAVTARIVERIAALDAPGLRLPPAGERAPHILGLEVPDGAGGRVAAHLRDAGVVVGVRGRTVRISPHMHTSAADVDRFVEALRAFR